MTPDPSTEARLLPAIEYVAIPEGEAPGLCYMCFPPHNADYKSAGNGSLRLCRKVLARLVDEGKAMIL